MGVDGLYGTVFSTFLEVELVSDRVSINRKEEEVFSVRLSSMKACRSGNLRYRSDRYVRGGKQPRSGKFKGPTVKKERRKGT